MLLSLAQLGCVSMNESCGSAGKSRRQAPPLRSRHAAPRARPRLSAHRPPDGGWGVAKISAITPRPADRDIPIPHKRPPCPGFDNNASVLARRSLMASAARKLARAVGKWPWTRYQTAVDGRPLPEADIEPTPTSQPYAVPPACVQSLSTRTMVVDDAHNDHNQPGRFP